MKEKVFVITGSVPDEIADIYNELIMRVALKGIRVSPLRNLSYIAKPYNYTALYIYIDYKSFKKWNMYYYGFKDFSQFDYYNFRRKNKALILTLDDLPFLLDLMS